MFVSASCAVRYIARRMSGAAGAARRCTASFTGSPLCSVTHRSAPRCAPVPAAPRRARPRSPAVPPPDRWRRGDGPGRAPCDQLGVGTAVACQQARALQLQCQRRQRVREHVVHLARQPPAFGRRRGAGLGRLRGFERRASRRAACASSASRRTTARPQAALTVRRLRVQPPLRPRLSSPAPRQHQGSRAALEPHRRDDPDEVRPCLPDPLRLQVSKRR